MTLYNSYPTNTHWHNKSSMDLNTFLIKDLLKKINENTMIKYQCGEEDGHKVDELYACCSRLVERIFGPFFDYLLKRTKSVDTTRLMCIRQ